jgi:hypothetical protein
MQQAHEVDAQGISNQREQFANAIAHILWGVELQALPVPRQVTCHQIAFYTAKTLNAQQARDAEGNK